jgi:uncharacterized pyridoxamine 5'-phosphate oxidase family protein
MSNYNELIKEYLKDSKKLVLATVDSDNKPRLRTIGGFVINNFVTYFSTGKDNNKVLQIEGNNNVEILFEHENQQIPNFKNVTINGKAENIVDPQGFKNAAEVILVKKPHLKISQETSNIYKIVPEEIKVLDFSLENIEDRVQIIKI